MISSLLAVPTPASAEWKTSRVSEGDELGLLFGSHTSTLENTRRHSHKTVLLAHTRHTQAHPCPPASNEADNKLLHALL